MSRRRISLKADYPVEAGSYVQRTPPSRVPPEVPAWIRQEQAAGYLEILRLERVKAKTKHRLSVQREAYRARKEYYGPKYGTMFVPEFEAHVKGWEQQQYRAFDVGFEAWKVEQIAGFNVAAQAAIPKFERTMIPAGFFEGNVIPAELRGMVAFTAERDPTAISKSFYTDIGFPQYAGKYDPFLTPEGYKVSGIEKTGKGLQITFESAAPEPAKGIAETIMSWKLPSISIPSIIPEDIGKGIVAFLSLGHVEPYPWQKEPSGLKAPAGLVAAIERPVYTVGRLLGYETPHPPPTFTGGLIGKGIEAGFGISSTELEKTMAYGTEYAAGTVAGDIFISWVIGKGIEKSPLGPPLAKLEMGIMSKIREPIIGTRLDKFLLKHSKYWATLQEYKAGTVVFGATPKKWSPFRYRGKTITPMSVTLKKAISDTSGSVLLPQLFTTPKILFTPSKTVSPFSLFSQTLGVTITLGAGLLTTPISDVSLTAAPISTPVIRTKTMQALKPKHLTRKKISSFPVLTTHQTEKPGLFELSKISIASITGQPQKHLQTLWQPQKQTSIVTQAQLQKQLQKQVQALSTLTRPSKPSFQFEYPQRKRKKLPSRKKGKTGRYKREYPLMTPSEMLKKMIGKTKF